MIYIGVDGGGTKTALAAYKDGALVAQTKSGAMNYNFIGVARAAEHLIAGVRALTLPPEDIAAIGIGDPSIDDAAPANDNSLTAQFVRQVTQTLGIPVYTVRLDGRQGERGADAVRHGCDGHCRERRGADHGRRRLGTADRR